MPSTTISNAKPNTAGSNSQIVNTAANITKRHLQRRPVEMSTANFYSSKKSPKHPLDTPKTRFISTINDK
jgi:hypothetical protein